MELKRKTDEPINLVNSLEPWDQSDGQKQIKLEDKIFRFEIRVKQWKSDGMWYQCVAS